MKNYLHVISAFLLAMLIATSAASAAHQSDKSNILTESVTLLSPPNDTTVQCPAPEVFVTFNSTVAKAGLVSYHIQASTDSNFTTFPLFVDDYVMGPGNQTNMASIPPITSPQTVYWRVTIAGNTDWSVKWRINYVKSLGPTSLSPPDNSTACMSVTFSWTNAPNSKQVVFVLRSNSVNGPILRIDSANGTSLNSVDFQISTGTTDLYWTVINIDSTGKQTASLPRKLTLVFPDIVTLLEPQNQTVFIQDIDSIALLRWTINPDAKLYIVYVAGPNGYSHYDTLTNTSLSFHLQELKVGDYTWRVRCMCDKVLGGSFGPAHSFVISTGSDVQLDNESMSVQCTPNPIITSAHFSFTPLTSELSHAYICNTLGSKVYQCSAAELQHGAIQWNVNASCCPAGQYFLVLSDGIRNRNVMVVVGGN